MSLGEDVSDPSSPRAYQAYRWPLVSVGVYRYSCDDDPPYCVPVTQPLAPTAWPVVLSQIEKSALAVSVGSVSDTVASSTGFGYAAVGATTPYGPVGEQPVVAGLIGAGSV